MSTTTKLGMWKEWDEGEGGIFWLKTQEMLLSVYGLNATSLPDTTERYIPTIFSIRNVIARICVHNRQLQCKLSEPSVEASIEPL